MAINEASMLMRSFEKVDGYVEEASKLVVAQNDRPRISRSLSIISTSHCESTKDSADRASMHEKCQQISHISHVYDPTESESR